MVHAARTTLALEPTLANNVALAAAALATSLLAAEFVYRLVESHRLSRRIRIQ
jgi:peptidoglycan/LPS O-acetylase OafA/YrhL